MALYESVFIARPDITSAQVETLTEELKGIVDQNGGAVNKTEYWGLKSLAYRIKKNRKGHYSLLNLDAPSAAVSELERNMRLNEDVLRYMTIRVDELEEGPSIMLQSRSRDGDRGGRGRDRDRGDRGDRRPRAEATAKPGDEKPKEKPEAKAEEKPEEKPEAKAETEAKGDET